MCIRDSEINNPLAYVLLNIDYARSELAQLVGGSGGDRVREVRLALDRVSEGAGRIRDIVRGLKTFSRPESETVAPLQVARVLESTLAMMLSDNWLTTRGEMTSFRNMAAYYVAVRGTGDGHVRPSRVGDATTHLRCV